MSVIDFVEAILVGSKWSFRCTLTTNVVSIIFLTPKNCGTKIIFRSSVLTEWQQLNCDSTLHVQHHHTHPDQSRFQTGSRNGPGTLTHTYIQQQQLVIYLLIT